ncbi:isoleucyl-tRNA synthetase [Streptococcus pneumoniae]|nr:isoleucyl-tRNA synthetase [Streptococcus pneumoniae]
MEEARNAKVIGKSLEAHLTVYQNEVVKTLLEAVNSNVAQLLIVSELTIVEENFAEAVAEGFEEK